MSADAGKRSPRTWEAFALGVIHGRRTGFIYELLRANLYGLSQLHAAGLAGYLFAEKIGLRKRTRINIPVISIGNITSGGTGKTPVTQALVRLLQHDDMRPAILSRGHGGSFGRESAQVSDSQGNILMSAKASGDESFLLARSLPGVPVFVGKDRRISAELATKIERPDVIVLDDGMQYWQLHRDLDIVLIDARHPYDNGFILPRGALREPKGNLSRAGIVIITRSNLIPELALKKLKAEIERIARTSSVYTSSHVFGGLHPLNDAAIGKLPNKPFAVCGIAQPNQFFDMVCESGLEITHERRLALPDHSDFDENTLKHILELAESTGADSILMTEKDCVKIDPAVIELPLYAVKLKIVIERQAAFYADVVTRADLISKVPRTRRIGAPS